MHGVEQHQYQQSVTHPKYPTSMLQVLDCALSDRMMAGWALESTYRVSNIYTGYTVHYEFTWCDKDVTSFDWTV